MLSSFSSVFFGMFGICFLFNCISKVSFPSPCTDGSIWVCGSVCGDGEARQCHGQGTGARALSAPQLLNFSQPGGF